MDVKVKVLLPFRDKETKKDYQKNDVTTVSVKRFNEIMRRGHYLELVDEKPTKG